MRNRMILIIIFVIACMIIYSFVFSYTTQINHINKNNTYEVTSVYENYRIDFVNKYIETLKNYDYAAGFDMIDDSAKANFSNDLNKYTEYIINQTRNMNKTIDGLNINLQDEYYMKKYNIIEYDIISKDYEYTKDNETYFSEEYKVFNEFKLIEYSPNVFKIYIK